MEITQEQVRKAFNYDPESGILTWVDGRRRTKIGKIAGSLRSDGYYDIRFNYKLIRAHRLIWMYMYGYFPDQIDHINGIRGDNRLCNLRESNNHLNHHNVKRKKRLESSEFKSRFLGVSWSYRRKKWIAQIKLNRKGYHLGAFDIEEDAAQAYKDAKLRLHAFNPVERD